MKYYPTDDTALASFLYLKGVKIVQGTTPNPKHPRRRFFIFIEDGKLADLIKQFYERRALVVPIEYQEARTYISRFLKVDIKNPKEYI